MWSHTGQCVHRVTDPHVREGLQQAVAGLVFITASKQQQQQQQYQRVEEEKEEEEEAGSETMCLLDSHVDMYNTFIM